MTDELKLAEAAPELLDALVTLWRDTPQPHYSASIEVRQKYYAAHIKMQRA